MRGQIVAGDRPGVKADGWKIRGYDSAAMTFSSMDNLLLIVVGAHLRAEEADRPLAYKLKRRIDAWLDQNAARLNIDIEPIVCSDLWYLNQEHLQQRP